MAKVMVSLPDDVLQAIDAAAANEGTTRSGLLREMAEESLRRRSAQRAARMAHIDRTRGPAVGRGGGVVEVLHAHRPER